MIDWYGWVGLSCVGFVLSSTGGLGGELLDKFAGRSLEAYCRLKKNRERFGAVLDGQDASIRASEYLRMIGTVLFLISGTAAIFVGETPPSSARLIAWALVAGVMMMMTHVWAAIGGHAIRIDPAAVSHLDLLAIAFDRHETLLSSG